MSRFVVWGARALLIALIVAALAPSAIHEGGLRSVCTKIAVALTSMNGNAGVP